MKTTHRAGAVPGGPMGSTGGRRGSVRKDKARGTYTVVVDIAPVGEIARRQLRRRGFRTEREAQRELTSLLAELDAGTFVAPDPTTTLATYVEETWLPALGVKQLRASTLESYQRNLEVHVLPVLGRRPLSAISTAELDRLYSDLLTVGGVRGPLAPRTVRYIHTILLGVFGHAVRKGHLAVNPCARADVPSPRACRSREMQTWTASQLASAYSTAPRRTAALRASSAGTFGRQARIKAWSSTFRR